MGDKHKEVINMSAKELVQAEHLRGFCSQILASVNVPQKDAELTAHTLVEADLRGVHSHGTTSLLGYVKCLRLGGLNPKPQIKPVMQIPAVSILDGDGGLGQVVSVRAMREAMDKAKENGVGLVGVRNSSHFGAAAYYPMMALEEDMIGFANTNGKAVMVPWGGKASMMGNNPISYAIPAGQELPIVLDMSLSVVAGGKIRMAALEGKKIPLGWALNQQGQPTDDPEEAMAKLLLTPLGGHKGYGLAVVMDILAGVLTGSAFGRRVNSWLSQSSERQKVGHLFVVLNIETFMPVAEFKEKVDRMIREIKSTPLAKGFERIYLPGEIEFEKKAEYLKTGIPLPIELIDKLRELGKELHLEFPL